MGLHRVRNIWPSIDPGRLKHNILIQERADGVDAEGQESQTYITVWSCKASIDTMIATYEGDSMMGQRPAGSEIYHIEGGLVSGRATHTIMIRWTGLVRFVPGMRVVHVDQRYSPPASRIFNVEWIENVQMRDIILRLHVWSINQIG